MSDENQVKAPEAPAAPAAQSGPPSRCARRTGRSSWRTPRRPRWTRRSRQILPSQESLQVLHREDRRHPLSGCTSVARLCGRTRQDRAPSPHRRLHHASAAPHPCHQAGTQYRPASFCNQALTCSPFARLCEWRVSCSRLNNFAGDARARFAIESAAAQLKVVRLGLTQWTDGASFSCP